VGGRPGGGGARRLRGLIRVGGGGERVDGGDRSGAAGALGLGLVDYVVPMNQLIGKCAEIAAEICKSAPLAVQRIKQAALRGLDMPLGDGLKLERELYEWLQKTDDAREGAIAFTEKRPPRWQSR